MVQSRNRKFMILFLCILLLNMFLKITAAFLLLVVSASVHALNPSAASTNPDDINFYTYPDLTKPYDSHNILINDPSSLKNSGLKPGLELVKVIIHVHNTSWTTAPLNAYRNHGFTNIIWADREKLASPSPGVPESLEVISYPAVLKNVKRTGKRIAEMIEFLISNGIIAGPENVHFVSWSTGAHVAATASNYLKSKYSSVVSRITGLDPVGPLSKLLKNNRLSKDKASFVDVIHTSNLFLGTAQSIGHVDFFVNGGLAVKQPGCPFSTLTSGDFNTYFLCAPRLAITLYALTIDPDVNIGGCKCLPIPSSKKAFVCKSLPLIKCTKKVRMGEYALTGTRGNYYVSVQTNPGPD